MFCFPEESKVKKAKVQWYIRYCEVPHNKRKLLGRSAHPKEIFYYSDTSCDSEVDAETILGTVEVMMEHTFDGCLLYSKNMTSHCLKKCFLLSLVDTSLMFSLLHI